MNGVVNSIAFGASLLAASTPLLVTRGAAQSVPAAFADLGVARVDSTGGCLAIRREGIASGTRLTLVFVPPGGSHDSSIAIAAGIDGAAVHGSAACPATFGDEGDQFYRFSLDRPAMLRAAYFALFAPRESVSLGVGSATVTLGPDRASLRLRTCVSTEGVHLTAWRGAGPSAQRAFHAYYYVGYDMVPTCSAAETGTRPPSHSRMSVGWDTLYE